MRTRLIAAISAVTGVVLLLPTGVHRAAADTLPEGMAASADEATITVYRPKQLGAGGSVVELDGLPIAELASGQYVNLRVALGPHVVSQHDYRSERITVDAKPGQTYFVKSWLGFGIINPASHLALVAAEIASQEVRSCSSVSPAAWIVPDSGMRIDEQVESRVAAAGVGLVVAEWIPNAQQEGGWAVYPAAISLDTEALRIDISTRLASDVGVHDVRIPLSAIASAESGVDTRNRSICWVTVRRTSGHVDQIRAHDCTALHEFGESLRSRLSGTPGEH